VKVGAQTVIDKHVHFKSPSKGAIALAAYAGGVGQCTVYYDNVVVLPLTADPAP
jgi:hypothetical protein